MRRIVHLTGPALGGLLLAGLLPGSAQAEDPAGDDPAVEAVVVVTRPSIDGTLRSGRTLTLRVGTYEPTAATTTVTWFRDGTAVPGRTGRTYQLGKADVKHRLRAEVTASAEHRSPVTTSTAPTALVRLPALTASRRPVVRGTRRYDHVLRVQSPRWSGTRPTSMRYRWLRDGRPIGGATSSRYRVSVEDVGHKLSVQVTGRRSGHESAVTTSSRTKPIHHRVDVRRTVTYSVVRDGRTRSDFGTFVRRSAVTYADARGWRGAGVSFRRVRRGGDFTLVLAAASRLPRYSSECSVNYSCRVGRNVVINEARWRLATRVWRGQHRSLRDYRHMVVNHETGHWFGEQHVTCSGRGRLAPVMMQQSKGLSGCRTNPWPLRGELGLPRYGWRAP